jgi:hypothetical protein
MEDNVDTPSRRADLLDQFMAKRLFDGKISPKTNIGSDEDDVR